MESVRTDERTGQPTTWISTERLHPKTTVGIVLLYALFSALISGALIALSYLHDASVPAESFYDRGAGWLLQKMPVDVARILTAIAAGSAAGIWGLVGRRLYHSDSIGVATTGLLALDTGFLLQGHLVQGLPWQLLFAGIAVLLALQPNTKAHWGIPVPLALYGLENRTSLLLGIGLFAMIVMRGHIYASNKHVLTAFWQTAPALTGLLAPFHWQLLNADAFIPGPGAVHIHNPAIWYTGAIAAVAGIGGALLYMVGQFRMARHPGRVQFRMQQRLPRIHGRILWNAALLPVLLPALVMHLLGGIRALTEDSRAFRYSLYIGVCAFALVYIIRFWPLLIGDGSQADLDALEEILPWIQF